MKINVNKVFQVMILIITGAALQNIIWYFRLSKPILMREFIFYFNRDGARAFLDFNAFNYFPLVILLLCYLIYKLFKKRSAKGRIQE